MLWRLVNCFYLVSITTNIQYVYSAAFAGHVQGCFDSVEQEVFVQDKKASLGTE